MKNKHVGESFYHAFEGFSHVLWTQKHVRIQLCILSLALMLAYVQKVSTIELVLIISATAAVLMAELFNTAIEVVVNMITETYHPLAKIAKDVSAAAVLIASIYALMVAGGVFLTKTNIQNFLRSTSRVELIGQIDPTVVILLAIVVISIIVALAKVRIGHGTILRGGAVSGHSAVAFSLAAAITLASGFQPMVSIMAFLLALLVAQSRVEGKIHTLAEVIWGAIVAITFMSIVVILSPAR